MDAFKVIIVEDVKLELKGTEQIFHSEIPEAEIIGTAATEAEFWKLMRGEVPHLVLLDLGLGGSTTVGVDICRQLKSRYPSVRVLVFTGEVLNERLWVEVLSAGADGVIYQQVKFCDPWAYERLLGSTMLRDDYGYPVLSVDRPYNISAMIIVQATTVPLCFAAAAAVALSPVRSPV